MGCVHMFEPTGHGGVFQHMCGVAAILMQEDVDVVVHTGHEAEAVGGSDIQLDRCSWWPWGMQKGSSLRALWIGVRAMTGTIPHLLRTVGRGDVLHIQGGTTIGLITASAAFVGRARGARVVLSAHNTFSRRGRSDAALLRLSRRLSHSMIVFSRSDVRKLQAERGDVIYSPLVQPVVLQSESRRQGWRERWGVAEDEVVVLFAGSVRADKGLNLLVESARVWPENWHLAVVGQDRGAWDAAKRLAQRHGVVLRPTLGFIDLGEFCAAIAAADLVVAPYQQGSQSGVLSIASQLGTPSVAAAVGGLGELASRTFASGDVAALTAAIGEQLAAGDHPAREIDERATLEAHLRAYRIETPARRRDRSSGRFARRRAGWVRSAS